MRLFFTLFLLIVIPVTYYLIINMLESKVIEKKEYIINFSEDDSRIKKLDQMASYNSITKRPLFSESREQDNKIIVQKKVQFKPVIQDLKVQALGIAVTGEGILAVIKDLKNGKILRLRIKQKIYGWSLEGVSEESFVFLKDEQRKTISFKK